LNQIVIISETNTWPLNHARLEYFIREILLRIGAINWEIGLVITDNSGIRKYNRQWRKLDAATDVLSFVQNEGDEVPVIPGMPKEVGDIMISLEKIESNAREFGSSFEDELRRVIIHGILHLDGQNHPENDYSSGMLKMQEDLLVETNGIMIGSR